MINLTLPSNGIFFILTHLIYNPQRLISFWRNYHVLPGGKGWERLILSTARLALKSHMVRLSFSLTSGKPWVWAELISCSLWRPQRGLVHLWAGAASFRVRWRHLEDCRVTPQEFLLQIGSGLPPPLLKTLISFLTTKMAQLLSLNVLCHCSTSNWECCLSLRKNRAE